MAATDLQRTINGITNIVEGRTTMDYRIYLTVKVTGSNDEIESFRTRCFLVDEEDGSAMMFNFEAVIPSPPIIRDIWCNDGVEEAYFALTGRRMSFEDESIVKDFKKSASTREEYLNVLETRHPGVTERAQQAVRAEAETGFSHWRDWADAHWGAISPGWNLQISKSANSEIEFSFTVNLGLPIPIFNRLAQDFPTLTFTLSIHGYDFMGGGEIAYGKCDVGIEKDYVNDPPCVSYSFKLNGDPTEIVRFKERLLRRGPGSLMNLDLNLLSRVPSVLEQVKLGGEEFAAYFALTGENLSSDTDYRQTIDFTESHSIEEYLGRLERRNPGVIERAKLLLEAKSETGYTSPFEWRKDKLGSDEWPWFFRIENECDSTVEFAFGMYDWFSSGFFTALAVECPTLIIEFSISLTEFSIATTSRVLRGVIESGDWHTSFESGNEATEPCISDFIRQAAALT